MSALPYRIKEKTDEVAYRVYMSDVLITITKNMIKTESEPKRYWDIINPPPEETRTRDEKKDPLKEQLRNREEPPQK